MSSEDSTSFSDVEKNILTTKETIVHDKNLDETRQFMIQYESTATEPLTKSERRKLNWKLYGIVFLVSWTNLVFFMDKYTMSYAAEFGFFKAIHIDSGVNRYNNMNTLYYVGYIIGQVNLWWAQKVGNRKAMIILCFFWNIDMFLTCTLTSYQGAYVLRFFLGFIESIAMSLQNLTLQQILPAHKKARVAQFFMVANNFAQIPVSFIAYGLLKHSKNDVTNTGFPLWKAFILIISCITSFTFFMIVWFYPTNPTDLRYFSIKEKVWIIKDIQEANGSSIDIKVFKKYQAIEALKDPVTWYYTGAMFSLMLCNNISYIQNIIFAELGLTSVLNTYLVSAAGAGFSCLCGLVSFVAMKYYPRVCNTTYVAIFWAGFCLVPCILMAALSWNVNKKVFLALTLLAGVFGCSWINIVSSYQSNCAGYTKILVRSALAMAAYSIGNIIASRIYYDKGAPRYYVAWGIQSAGFFLTMLFMALAYYTLAKRNKERLSALESEKYDLKEKVEDANLDLTDLENKKFIYPI
ncbi:unnamed protein product [Hanseniaspora opuntiae]